MSGLALTYSARSEISYQPARASLTPGPGEVLVRPLFTGICGTDLLVWHDGHARATPPVVLGHEFSAEVITTGPGVDDIEPGRLVAVEPLLACGACDRCSDGAYNQCTRLRLLGVDVDGSLAPTAVAPRERIYPLPAGMDARAGAFVEPTAVACHVLRRIGHLPTGSTVFIAGGGPIGLIAAELLVRRGVRVALAEAHEFRAERGRRLGAEVFATFDEAVFAMESRAVRACVEATGVAAGLGACIRAASPGAVVGVVGLPKSVPAVDMTTVIGKELDLRGSRVYVREDFEAALEALAAGALTLDVHISHLVSFEDAIARGFEAIERREPILKVMVDHGRGV